MLGYDVVSIYFHVLIRDFILFKCHFEYIILVCHTNVKFKLIFFVLLSWNILE
jgi:hypothetical protein